ncbi:hypothetical protein [Nocardia gamkensis]|uniref:hypothetical protein n=1 Tax=Nocardia gamkensis TaxID=352869 RepID=UPI001B34FFAD|nr:hypothetical protein [Nocardia gamkensis]
MIAPSPVAVSVRVWTEARSETSTIAGDGVESGIAEYFGGSVGIVLVQVGQEHFLAGADAAAMA